MVALCNPRDRAHARPRYSSALLIKPSGLFFNLRTRTRKNVIVQSHMKNILGFVFAIALGFLGWYWWQNQMTSEPAAPPEIRDETVQDIIVTTPLEGDTITSPVQIRGQAVGTWFWEGTFSAEVTDDDGVILGNGFITNQPGTEWMTEALVPFTGEVEFTVPKDAVIGKLLLRKANPSALPENNAELEIPVRF